jgi:ferrous iron transport protein A
MSRADPARWEAPGTVPCADMVKLGRLARGIRGTVFRVGAEPGAAADGIAAAELERRLLEIGFVEGAAVEILHEGFIRRDPIAVRLDDMRVALRRRDADAILLRVGGKSASVVDAGG